MLPSQTSRPSWIKCRWGLHSNLRLFV